MRGEGSQRPRKGNLPGVCSTAARPHGEATDTRVQPQKARGQTPHPAPGAVAFERWDCRHRPELIPGPPGPPGQVSPCATSCCCSKHPAGSCLLVFSAARQCERLRLETAPQRQPRCRRGAPRLLARLLHEVSHEQGRCGSGRSSDVGPRPTSSPCDRDSVCVSSSLGDHCAAHGAAPEEQQARFVLWPLGRARLAARLAGQCANRAQQQARDIGHEREAGGWRSWSGMLPTPARLSCALHAAAGPALSRLLNLAGLPRSPRRPSPVSHDRRTEGRTWRYLAGWKLCFWPLAASGNNDVPITYQARAGSCKLWPDQRRVLAIHYSAAWCLPKRAILAFSIKSIHNTHLLPLQRKAEAVNEPRPPGFDYSSRIGPFCRLRTHLPS